MTNVILKASGFVFDVPMDLDLHILGGPFSLLLKTKDAISIDKVWQAFSDQLNALAGISLPTIPDGPWSLIMKKEIVPSLWISPDRHSGNVGAVLQLAFAGGLRLGTRYSLGGIEIVIEPEITISSLIISYDAEGDGLTVKAKIKTTVKNSDNAPQSDKEQLVNFPFPLPAQNSTSAFRLEYLGVGQRIGPTVQTVGDENPMEKIFEQLETQLHDDDPRTIITQLAKTFYHPDRDWFIAADMRLRELRLRLLFNDPAMYGLEISIPPTTPPTFFSGLLFEILYQKLSPNLGVYYGALTLPYAMRRIPLSGFILILPGFSAWIYTNGDFRINVGWPVTPNNAIGISLDILTGWAGFYFSKLRSGNNPGALPGVSYNPILEFGIGITVSASISIKAGPLSASLSASLAATFQGLLAWKGNETGSSLSSPPDHYWFAGTAAIAVVLQGSVDLCILKASVMISVSVSAGIAFEKGYQTVIPISASVSVRVSVKIFFFTIHLSFDTTIRHTFYIGQGRPASLNGPLAPGLRLPEKNNAWMPLFLRAQEQVQCLRAQQANSKMVQHPFRTPVRFQTPATVSNSPARIVLPVYFTLQPTVVYTQESKDAVNVIASLLMECPEPSDMSSGQDHATGYEKLIFQLIKWLLEWVQVLPGERLSDTLQRLSDMLGSGSERPKMKSGDKDEFSRELKKFFSQTLCFALHGIDSEKNVSLSSAAVLPMFDVLRLQINDQIIDFPDFNRTPENYADALNLYFINVGLVGAGVPGDIPKNSASTTPPCGPSMASYIFDDYFVLIARYAISTLLQDAREYEARQETELKRWASRATQGASDADSALQDYCSAIDPINELDFLLEHLAWWSIAGFGSRYLLSGLQLPEPAAVPPVLTPDNVAALPTQALYVLSGQQHALTKSTGEHQATLSFAPNEEADWIVFDAPDSGSAVARIVVTGDLPDMPDPHWIIQNSYATPVSQNADCLVLQPLSPITATPLEYPLKNSQTWRRPGQTCSLYPLPEPLLNRMQAQSTLRLNIWGVDEHDETSRVALTGSPVLQIRLALSRLSPGLNDCADGETDEPSPGIYLLNGTDETTREQIFLALQTDLTNARLHFLYLPPGKTEWVSDKVDARTLLAKINLSTLNQIEPFLNTNTLSNVEGEVINPEFASVEDVKNFLRLVWELSVVRAPGYYLHYQNAQGHGLPSSLFADTANMSKHDPAQSVIPGTSSGTANLMLVVEFDPVAQSQPQIERYHNSLCIASEDDNATRVCEVLDGQGTPVNEWHSTCTPGCIGFTVTWMPRNSTASELPTDQLYHLMQYKIDDNTDYKGSVWSLPVGPEGDHTDETRQLRQNVSLLPFLNNGDNVKESVPYAITGREVNLRFRLCDVYGNALYKYHHQLFKPAYCDPLIAPGEWPGLHISYYFQSASEQKALIMVKLEFTPNISSEAIETESDATAPWRAMRQKYQQILDQLNDTNATYTLHCTLTGNDAVDSPTNHLRLSLKAFVTRITDFIDKQLDLFARNNTLVDAECPMEYQFSLPLSFARVEEQTLNIVPIDVSIRIQRDESLIDKEVAGKIPAVSSIIYSLPAKVDVELVEQPAKVDVELVEQPSKVEVNNFRWFARNFEQAFARLNEQGDMLKLAQRAGNQTGNAPDEQPELWSVRFGAQRGVMANFSNNPVCFALRPLSPLPLSGQVDNIHYSNIDLDEWASRFLNAFDLFMSPQNGVAIALLDKRHHTRYFDRLMACKQQLAKAIPTALEPVLQKYAGAGDRPAAQTRLRQALQQNLAQAYTISTVVQLPAIVTLDGKTEGGKSINKAPQLYGSLAQPVQDQNTAAKLYQLSPTTLDLSAGEQWVTSLLTVTRPGEQSCIQLPLEYHISYLQHAFACGCTDDDYTSSSWLKFVLPGDGPLRLPVSATGTADACEEMTIFPLPIPFKPSLPVLLSQKGISATVDTKEMKTPGEAIGNALFWRYQVQVSAPLASQDTLYIDLIKNASVNTAPSNAVQRNSSTLDNFFESLARFHTAMSDITSGIVGIGQAATHEDIPDDSATALVQQFYELSHAIAESWPINDDREPLLNDSPQEIDHFCLTFSAVGKSYQLQLRARCDGSNDNPSFWPRLQINDGQAGLVTWQPDRTRAKWDGVWWKLEKPLNFCPDFSMLELDWHPLGMLRYQSARLSCWIVRNAELVPAQMTNPLFIYQTEEARFADALIPFIEHNDLPGIAAGKFSQDNLRQLMRDIFSTLVELSPFDIKPAINLQVNGNWPLGLSPLRATSPILLITALTLDDGSIEATADDVAEKIGEWYQQNLTEGLSTQLEFTLMLFGTHKGQQLPLVKMNKVPVTFED